MERLIPVMLAAMIGAACERGGAAQAAQHETTGAAAEERPPVHVDSIFPIEEELRRFREGMAEPDGLGHGSAHSRDALMRAFLAALTTRDTAALARMTLDRAEFAYLYYPHTVYTRPPYELSPALVWFQVQQNSEKGLVRVLRRLGGSPLDLLDYRCDAQPEVQERNRIWSGCELRLNAGSATSSRRLFGPIVERDGRFKFVSYANGL